MALPPVSPTHPRPSPPALEVNMPWEKAWGATNGHGKLRYAFPPTVFYMMKRDKQTKMQIEKALVILKNNGVPADYVYVSWAGSVLSGPGSWRTARACWRRASTGALHRERGHGRTRGACSKDGGHARFACHPGLVARSLWRVVWPPQHTSRLTVWPCTPLQIDSRPVTPDWLSMRSVYISPSQSAQIQKYLVKIKVLDAKGNVRYDVRVVSAVAGVWGGVVCVWCVCMCGGG